MFASAVTVFVSWIVFSTILVSLILINSSRVSQTNNPEDGTGKSAGEHSKNTIGLSELIKLLINY